MNRRDLLKIFGAGVSIVPVVSGVPILENTARIILPPTVEPVASKVLKPDIESLIALTSNRDTVRIVVTVIDKNGSHTTIEAEAFLLSWTAPTMVDVTTHWDLPESRWIPSLGSLGFEFKGQFTGPVKYRGF